MIRILLIFGLSIGAWLFFMVLAQAQTFDYNIISKDEEPEAYCLAQNILFEASVEPMAGKIAVGLVVLNRMNDSRYPSTICTVVKEGPIYESWKTRKDDSLSEDDRIYYPVKNRCQFSWYCDGKSDDIYPTENWYKSQIVALQLLDGKFRGMLEGATHYHANWVHPIWRHDLTFIGQIGDHLFYRWEN